MQKSFELQMLPPSGSVLPPGGVITQEMRVVATSNVSRVFSYLCYILRLQRYLSLIFVKSIRDLHLYINYSSIYSSCINPYLIVSLSNFLGRAPHASAHSVYARWSATGGADGG